MSLNNNVLNLINICGNGNEGISFINNYLKLIQEQNRIKKQEKESYVERKYYYL